ncbi:hypothetical protein ACP70R_002430 [Stipagrostis hirtigluma subsp. patula]
MLPSGGWRWPHGVLEDGLLVIVLGAAPVPVVLSAMQDELKSLMALAIKHELRLPGWTIRAQITTTQITTAMTDKRRPKQEPPFLMRVVRNFSLFCALCKYTDEILSGKMKYLQLVACVFDPLVQVLLRRSCKSISETDDLEGELSPAQLQEPQWVLKRIKLQRTADAGRTIHLSKEYFNVNCPPASFALVLKPESFSASLRNSFKLLRWRSDKSSCSMSSLVPRMVTFLRISAVRRCSSRSSDGGTASRSAISAATSSTSRSASWNRFVHCSRGEAEHRRTSRRR